MDVSRTDDATRSLETLWRYLTSLRPKLAGALASHHITLSQAHLFPTLSSTSPASLYALPSGIALTNLTEDELVKRAQIVDTALFKSYLIGRPSMLGPLCRLPNWCEVEEVEEELRAREVCPISRHFPSFLCPRKRERRWVPCPRIAARRREGTR